MKLAIPVTARILSADPIINSIYNTQAYNRFSYVWNNPLKFVDPMGYDGAPPVTNVPVGQGLSGGISSVTGWQYGNSGSPCTCSTMPNTPVLNIDRNSSSSGIMDAHYRLVLMGTAMSALSTHLNSYINHTNGYGSTYGLGLAGFGYNQTPVSSGGISSSSSPSDYALAQGPPGMAQGGAGGLNNGRTHVKPNNIWSNTYLRTFRREELGYVDKKYSMSLTEFRDIYNGERIHQLLNINESQGYNAGIAMRYIEDPLYKGIFIDSTP